LDLEASKQMFGTVVSKQLRKAVECCIEGIECASVICIEVDNVFDFYDDFDLYCGGTKIT